MLEKCHNTSTVKINMDCSSESDDSQAPPPFSEISDLDCSEEKSADSSESLSQLLGKRNVFHIKPETGTGRQVFDGNGTLLLSILMRQPYFNGHSWIQNLFLNSTGKLVLEMAKLMEHHDIPEINRSWAVYEDDRQGGMLTHGHNKSELVGYYTENEIFRAVELGPYSLALRGDGKDLAFITTKVNHGSTSLVIVDQDVEYEVKALLLCCALFYEELSRPSACPDFIGGECEKIVQRRKRSTCTNRHATKRSMRIRGALNMTIQVFFAIILVILVVFLPFILMKAVN